VTIDPTRWSGLARGAYLGLVLLQPVWLYALPPPAGPRSALLALIATLPLLLPLAGVWRGSLRSMTWGGYLSMLYLVIGVTEAWANPPQRPAALAQVALVAMYIAAVVRFSRAGRRGA
jgi:uncharacterized membrane protein